MKFCEEVEFFGTQEVQEVPMEANAAEGTFYTLTLDYINVGNNRLNI
uniref:Uncharacterized protein n=1 Tax=Nymphaea colorata TaxID=210225 RepID=A0A5K1EL94_9MAGN|nr:unnamed protein product [Nymphaea colorata]